MTRMERDGHFDGLQSDNAGAQCLGHRARLGLDVQLTIDFFEMAVVRLASVSAADSPDPSWVWRKLDPEELPACAPEAAT